MAASRDVTRIINYILDNLCPPILRDCYWLMYPIYRVACGKDTAKLLRYKENFPFLDEKGYAEYYEISAKTPLSKRPTDLDKAGINFVLSHIKPGDRVLEAGCGRGFMARKISEIISANSENNSEIINCRTIESGKINCRLLQLIPPPQLLLV